MARIATKVSLSESEKAKLTSIIKKGTHKSRKITRARALLLMIQANQGHKFNQN
jgi:hypothetical protein